MSMILPLICCQVALLCQRGVGESSPGLWGEGKISLHVMSPLYDAMTSYGSDVNMQETLYNNTLLFGQTLY